MKQKQRILLLGSTGYLGRTLMTPLQQTGYVVPTHRSKAQFIGSRHYDFRTDNVHSLVEHHQIDDCQIAAGSEWKQTIGKHLDIAQFFTNLCRTSFSRKIRHPFQGRCGDENLKRELFMHPQRL